MLQNILYVSIGQKMLDLFYKIIKKLARTVSYWRHNYACYKNGRTVWLTVKRHTSEVIPKQLIKEHKKLWRPLSMLVPGVFVKAYAALTGVKSAFFVPENIYYTTVEPILNNALLSAAYEDKALIDWFHDAAYIPEIYLRNIHGVYYDGQRKKLLKPELILDKVTDGKVIVKPTIETQGGRNILVFSFKENEWLTRKGERLSIEFLESRFKQNFVVQAYVEQHPFYRQFNASSLNTLRVMTYRSVQDNKIHVLHAVLRVGARGSEVDNQSLGGYACGIKSNGELNSFAADKDGVTTQTLAEGKIKLSEAGKAHGIDKVKAAACLLAESHYHSRLLGFDLCVDKNSEVRLIEVNNMDIGMELTQHLVGPLFGELTTEVIDYCKDRLPHLKRQIV